MREKKKEKNTMEFHEIKDLWAETIAGEDTRDKGKATTMLHAFMVC